MSMLLAVAAMLQAPSVERWTCVYPAYGGGEPVSVTLDLKGDELLDVDFALPYKVILRNERAIVATYATDGPHQGKYQVNARTIAIDRQTGDMIVSNIDYHGPSAQNAPVRGKCGRAAFQ